MLQLSVPSQNPCSNMTAEEEVICLQCKHTLIYPVIINKNILQHNFFNRFLFYYNFFSSQT